MASMPEETRQKIIAANRKAWESPAIRKRTIEGIKRSWDSPGRRERAGKERREFWRKWREAKATAKAAHFGEGLRTT
jgi:hypothetical protein